MPELPEVETMVRGLRPAMLGRKLRRVEVLDPFLLHGCPARRPGAARPRRDGERGGASREVGRRDPGRHEGNHRHSAADDGKLLAHQARSTRPHPPGVPRGETPSDGLVLRHAAAGQDRLVSRCRRGRRGVRSLARAGCPRDRSRRAGGAAQTNGPRDQADLDGPESARGHRQYLRRRDPACLENPSRAGRRHALARAELERLHRAIGDVLATAIRLEGSSFDAGYRTVLGLEGGFLAQNSVYGRAELPCRVCSQPIVKTKIAGLIGRPTYFCPRCQRTAENGCPIARCGLGPSSPSDPSLSGERAVFV